MQTIQITQITIDQFDDRFIKLQSQIERLEKVITPSKSSEVYLTRREVADLLKIELSTLHNWCKKGKLNPVGLGNRVYFLRSDIEKALKPLNGSGI